MKMLKLVSGKYKYVLIFCLILINTEGFAQIKIFPTIGFGTQTIDNAGAGPSTRWNIYTPLRVGFNVKHQTLPFSLSYSYKHLLVVPNVYVNPVFEHQSKNHAIEVIYRYKKNNWGLGHYWSSDENLATFFFLGESEKYRGISISSTIDLDGLGVQLRKDINYAPSFDVLGHHLTSVNMFYEIGKQKAVQNRNRVKSIEAKVGLLLNMYPFSDVDTLQNFPRYAVGASVEFLFPKLNTSFNIERDWRIRIIAGMSQQSITHYVKTTTIGLGYQLPVYNRKMKIGLGGTFITDLNTIEKVRANYFFTGRDKDLFFVNVKGISTYLSYPVLNNVIFEVKHVFPIRGEETFSLRRSSFGLKYLFEL